MEKVKIDEPEVTFPNEEIRKRRMTVKNRA